MSTGVIIMADLSTTYMGIQLKNPLVAGASKLTSKLEKIKELEAAGVGAIVCASLFEEQIELERLRLHHELEGGADISHEMIDVFAHIEHGGPEQHFTWVKTVKESVDIPVIASLNAKTKDVWVKYAKALEATGVDGLELNFYFTPKDEHRPAQDVEQEQLDTLKAVKAAVNIPISVKLSYFYTNPMGFIKQLEAAGAQGVILFNRLFQPDIDFATEEHTANFNLSEPGAHRLSLRYAGLLQGNTNMTIVGSTGVHSAADVVKLLLAGANAVQMVSAFYLYGTDYARKVLPELDLWMEKHEYKTISDFQGKLSKNNVNDPFVYKRAQYVNLLLKSEELIGKLTQREG